MIALKLFQNAKTEHIQAYCLGSKMQTFSYFQL